MDSLTSSQKMIVMGKQVTEHSSSFMVNSMFTAWFSRVCHFQATCPWRNCLSILCLNFLIYWNNKCLLCRLVRIKNFNMCTELNYVYIITCTE